LLGFHKVFCSFCDEFIAFSFVCLGFDMFFSWFPWGWLDRSIQQSIFASIHWPGQFTRIASFRFCYDSKSFICFFLVISSVSDSLASPCPVKMRRHERINRGKGDCIKLDLYDSWWELQRIR
jgi:hypothetical protein